MWCKINDFLKLYYSLYNIKYSFALFFNRSFSLIIVISIIILNILFSLYYQWQHRRWNCSLILPPKNCVFYVVLTDYYNIVIICNIVVTISITSKSSCKLSTDFLSLLSSLQLFTLSFLLVLESFSILKYFKI